MSSPDSQGDKKKNQDQLGIGDRSTHGHWSPHMKEFSKLLKTLPDELLWGDLSTQQQRNLAQSLWEACNYKGKPKPGEFKDIEPKREYLEWVLRIEHDKQWQKALEKR
jgi:hypothetical protein